MSQKKKQKEKSKKAAAELQKQQAAAQTTGMPRIFCLLQSPAVHKSKESTPPQSLRFDPDVKIPSRGKSSLNSVINYTHAEEVEH